jgi:hypothetical protein
MFLAMIERQTKRRLEPGKRGPKPRTPTDKTQGDLSGAPSLVISIYHKQKSCYHIALRG